MKRWIIVLSAVTLLSAPLVAQTVSGGLPFWIPESMYTNGTGSVVFEPALGPSPPLRDWLFMPLTIAVDHLYPVRPQGASLPANPRPWVQANSLIVSASLLARLPISRFYVDFLAGGSFLWNITMSPIVSNIEADIAAAGHTYSFADQVTIAGGRTGWGWFAGGGVGMTFDGFSLGLRISYRTITTEATVTGTYYDIDEAASTMTAGNSYDSGLITFLQNGIIAEIEFTFGTVTSPVFGDSTDEADI